MMASHLGHEDASFMMRPSTSDHIGCIMSCKSPCGSYWSKLPFLVGRPSDGCQPTGDLRISLLGFAPLSARGSRRTNSWSTQNRWHSATKPAAAELTVNDGAQTTPQATPKPALKQPSAKRPPPCMRDTGIQSVSHCAFRTSQRRWTSVAGGERQKRDRTLKVGWMQPQFADTPRQPAPNLSIKINALAASCSRQEFKTQ